MNAAAFRHFYDYHFAENRKLWDRYITKLSYEQFTQPAAYSRGSVRDQILHLMNTDEGWFSELRGAAPVELPPAGNGDDRDRIRAHWDGVERRMREYLAALRDDMLFSTPIEEPEEDRGLVVWQVLLHVANHGTDHRAQLLRQLSDLGVKTRSQDYIFFVFESAAQEKQATKDELVAWLRGGQRRWEALLDQIGPARMEQPGVNGDWSMRDIVAHLTGWERRVVASLQAALRGEPEPPPPWPAHLEAEDDINAWIYEANRDRSAREVLADARSVFQQLLATVESLPDGARIVRIGPTFYHVWVGEERFPAGELFNHFRDDHEADVRAWLARAERE